MLSKGTGLRVSGAAGLLESIAAQIAVPGTPLHDRIEKKSSALLALLASWSRPILISRWCVRNLLRILSR